MKPLILHLLSNHLHEIVARSKRNCHALGVDSIMLLDAPEKTIRLFVTHEHHTLWQNCPDAIQFDEPMSVGFYAHHCNLTLHAVYGSFTNVIFTPGTFCADQVALREFEYRSPIKSGKGEFHGTGKVVGGSIYDNHYTAGQHVYMNANKMHTIAVRKGERAAWLVYEGLEDPLYKNLCYSNTDLEKFDFNGLYAPMDQETVLEVLESVELF